MEQQKENNYYTPELEDFYTGFEFEYKPKEGPWVKVNYNNWMSPNKGMELDFCTENELLSNFNKLDVATKRLNIVRVKYLDSEDIESLGFKHYNEENAIERYELNGYFLYWYGNPFLSICKIDMNNQIFRGKIKNKSELKVLIKQLGIDV